MLELWEYAGDNRNDNKKDIVGHGNMCNMYIEHKYSDGSNITKFLVGSSGSVLDDNDHINDIY